MAYMLLWIHDRVYIKDTIYRPDLKDQLKLTLIVVCKKWPFGPDQENPLKLTADIK